MPYDAGAVTRIGIDPHLEKKRLEVWIILIYVRFVNGFPAVGHFLMAHSWYMRELLSDRLLGRSRCSPQDGE